MRVLHLLQAPASDGGGSVASLAAFLRVREAFPGCAHTPLLLGPSSWAQQAAEAGVSGGFSVSLSPDAIERRLRPLTPSLFRDRSLLRARGQGATGAAHTFDRVLAWSTGAEAWWRARVEGSSCVVLPMDRPLLEWAVLGLPPPVILPPESLAGGREDPAGLGLKVGLISDPPDGGDARIAAWTGSLLESMGVHTTAVLSSRIGFRNEAMKLHRQLDNTNGLLTPPGVLPSLLSSLDAAIVQPVAEPRASVATLVGMARSMGVVTVAPPRLRSLLASTGGDDPALVAPGPIARDFAQTLAAIVENGRPDAADIREEDGAFLGFLGSLLGAPSPASA